MKEQKKVYQWFANSNAAPFFSDTSSGFIEATDPMSALKQIVENYDHPCGLYAAVIKEPTPKNPVVARYLSDRAATLDTAPSGMVEWKGDELYVSEKKMPNKKGFFELVKK